MIKLLQTVNALLGLMLTLAVLGALAGGGWWAYRTYHAEKYAKEDLQKELNERDQQIDRLTRELTGKVVALEELGQKVENLEEDLQQKEKEVQRLTTAIKLLKVDHRLAYIDVLDQEQNEQGEVLQTQFRFVEVNREGRPIDQPRTLTVDGDKVFLDALVVKFDDRFVEEGDPLRATNLCLFQRAYGEQQAPADGFRLDAEGEQPAPYRSGGRMTPFEQELWASFWEYANDLEKSREAGIRAAHGEVVYLKVVPGVRYKVTLRASDGLSMTPEGPIPDIEQDTL